VCEEALERNRHLDRLAARSAWRKHHRFLGSRVEQHALQIKQHAQDRAVRLAEQARGAAHAPDSTRERLSVAKPDIVRFVDKLGEQVVTCILDDFWMRLQDSDSHVASKPLGIFIWDLLLACELADPTTHDETFDVPDKTLHAVHLICDRFRIVDKEACMDQIEMARGLCHGPHKVTTGDQQDLSKSNVLAFFCRVYDENYGADNSANMERGMAQWKELPIYAQSVKAVFSIMVSSTVVEALFNKYSFAKNRFCSSMLDKTAASILSTQELEDLIGNVKKPLVAFFELRSVALADELNWT
jgi:hypothetical protein